MDRTEELGLAGILPISVGGQRVELRTLNLEESEKWLAKLDTLGASTGVDIPVDLALDVVLAYDVDGILDREQARKFSKRELHAALNQMTVAESPFLEDARSAVAASGPISRLGPLMYRLAVQSAQESSTSSPSQSGDSTRKRSAKSSLRSVS